MLSDNFFRAPLLDAADIESIIECYRETVDSWMNEDGEDQVSLHDLIGMFVKQVEIHVEFDLYKIVENSLKKSNIGTIV